MLTATDNLRPVENNFNMVFKLQPDTPCSCSSHSQRCSSNGSQCLWTDTGHSGSIGEGEAGKK